MATASTPQAPALSVCGRTTANSSPPKRAKTSGGRSVSRTAPQSSDSTTSPTDLDQIYYQFFSPARAAERVETVGAKIKDEVDQIVAMIEAAIGATAQYQNELEDSSRKLALPIDKTVAILRKHGAIK